MISIKNLSVKYNTTEVIRDLSLDLQKGEIYTLIGPSGCGKSTLLKILSGIKKDYSGSIIFNGKPIQGQQVSIGYVPQNYGLLEWKTVKQNIYLPLTIDNHKQLRKEENDDIIRSLEIEDLLDRYPHELSGGQKQRISLARAFISQPDILLMDEPFSALDAFTSISSQQLFLRLWEKYRVTTLLITHNIYEATSIGKHILLMSKTTGNVIRTIENTTFNKDGIEAERSVLANNILKLFEANQ
ncbi:MAG: ABC transporter ATP-binding protein [Dysgonomonas sp.]